MPVNILNRSGPLSFKSETNNTENLSINSLLSNFYNPGSNNFSISQSYYQLENRIGNSNSDSRTINITKALGVGFINKDNRRPIKFSEFYGASYISSSFNVAASTGVATVKIYSPSVVQNNNFLTNNIQDKIYQYTLYSKSDVTTPIVDSGWNKMFSYAKSGDNVELFYNLINTKAYKLVSKDCLSNAFTSSMFIGTCTSTVVDNTTYTYTLSAADLPTASSLLFQKINSDKTSNGYTNTKITDLSNILNNLNSLLQNPNITTYKSSGQLLPVISYKDNLGYSRTLTFDGLILQKSTTPDGPLGYFYTGLVTATSSGGTNPIHAYSFENTSTFGQITLYILGTQDSNASSCTPPPTPTTVGNFPTNISFTGPRCGYLDCGDGYTQPVCNPTSTTQIKHSGSFIITNNNNAEMLATISPTWTNLDGTPLNSLISTVDFTPTGMFSISANSIRKISIGFGLSNYENTLQPKTFTAKGSVNLTLPLGYSPQSQNCEIIANFDKNSCNISLPIKQTWSTPNFWQAVGIDQLSCNSNPNSAQIISNPSSTIQVRHSGSFTITNNSSIKPITFTFDKNNWKNQNGTAIDSLLTPVEMNPDSPIVLQPNESKKISVSFGKNNYNNPSQPASIYLTCPVTATTDSDYYINPISQNTFYFSSDKNSCVVTIPKNPNWPQDIGISGGENSINCNCGTSTSPQICDPTLLTQIKHTGSFIIINNNPDSMTITLNQNWTNNDGSVLNSLLSPVTIDPQSPISIEPYKSKKISIGVGIINYSNLNQPSSIDIKNLAVASLPTGYTETSKDILIRFSSDKNKCKKQVVVQKDIWVTPSFWQSVGVDELSCNSNPNSAQVVSNPTSTTQIRHSGSFIITNNSSIKPVTLTFNKNNWTNYDNTTINSLLTPIEMDPDSPITLQPNESKKISVSFGKANYNNPSQPATVDLRCPFTATTDVNYYINPVSENYFYFSSNKNSCVVTNLKTPNWPVSIGLNGGANAINCDCGTSTSPQVCDPTLLTQIKHTGSFIIINNNPDSMTITLNQNWTNNDGGVLDSLLLPVIIDPQSPISIEPYTSKKISIGVGISNYTNESQPTSIDIKNLAVASLPTGYTETSKDISIRFLSDKNKCKKEVVTTVIPPVVTPVTSNIGCISYNPSMFESWTQIKLRTVVTIAYKTGTSADKTFAKAVVNALPNSGCTLPTNITQDGYSVSINWILDTAGGQEYVCTPGTSGQFSGTYTVVTTNSILGSANFYILFLRKNNNNIDAESYINLCQTGGVSSVG